MLCAVINCNNCNKKKDVHVGFHVFPKCNILLKKWINFCGRKDKINPKTARICSDHFTHDDFQNNLKFQMGFNLCRKLCPNAVPTVHSEKYSSILKDSSNRTKKLKCKPNQKKPSARLKKSEERPEFDFVAVIEEDSSGFDDKCTPTEVTYVNELKTEIEKLKKENLSLSQAAKDDKEEIASLKMKLEKVEDEKKIIENKLQNICSPGKVFKINYVLLGTAKKNNTIHKKE